MSEDNKDKQQGGAKKPLSINDVRERVRKQKLVEAEKKLEADVKVLLAAEATTEAAKEAEDAASEKAEATAQEVAELAKPTK